MKKSVLIVFVFIIFLLSIVFVSASWFSDFWKKAFSPVEKKIYFSPTCTETDGGLDLYNQGTTSGTDLATGLQVSRTDTCTFDGSLIEYYCIGNLNTSSLAVTQETFSCPSGYLCYNGACITLNSVPQQITCSDSDNGQNVYIQGTMSVTGRPPFIDSCVDSGILIEGFCSGNAGGTVQLGCPSGYSCSNGACISTNPPTTCTDTDFDAQFPDGKNPYVQGTMSVTGQPPFIDQCLDSNTLYEGFCNGSAGGIAQLSCPTGTTCSLLEGKCVNISASSSATCTDSDGGIDLYNKGNTNGIDLATGVQVNRTDSCDVNGNTLTEYFCIADSTDGKLKVTQELASCPLGYSCSNGACVSTSPSIICVDSDVSTQYPDGKNPLVQGTTSVTGQPPVLDSCLNSNTVTEGFCSGNAAATVQLTCPSGTTCSAGACITSVSSITCTDSDGGQNLYLQGTTSGIDLISGAQETQTDSCTSSGLLEFYCTTDPNDGKLKVTHNILSCPLGYSCSNGACISSTSTSTSTCIDSDGGNNLYVKGTASDGTTSKTDSCTVVGGLTYIIEAVCQNNVPYENPPALCPSGYSCSNGACISTSPSVTCSDSDVSTQFPDGKNPLVQGTTSTTGQPPRLDSCIDSNTVSEGYCSGNVMGITQISCPSGTTCSLLEGKCVSTSTPTCTDSDGGKNYFVFGYAQLSSEVITHPDACDSTNSNYLWETYCDSGNNVQAEKYLCGNGCSNGVCVGSGNGNTGNIGGGGGSGYGNCTIDGKEIISGTIISSLVPTQYCGRDGSLHTQKNTGISCSYDYECSSHNCGVVNNAKVCVIGNESCIVGSRIGINYCDVDKILKPQKPNNEFCQNFYECSSNICDNNVCTSSMAIVPQQKTTSGKNIALIIFFIIAILAISGAIIWVVYKKKKARQNLLSKVQDSQTSENLSSG